MGLFGPSKPVCPICHGRKSIVDKGVLCNINVVGAENDKLIYCKACRGTGHVERVWKEHPKCEKCYGLGHMILKTWKTYPDGSAVTGTLKETKKTCPYCKGSKVEKQANTFFIPLGSTVTAQVNGGDYDYRDWRGVYYL